MNDEIRMTEMTNANIQFCHPSGVENGAAGKPRHRREGRRLNEREVSESKSLDSSSRDVSSLRMKLRLGRRLRST
jgi:hypothetical protein